MIVATRNGQSVEIRANPFANDSNLGSFYGTGVMPSVAGPLVGTESASALPAVAAAIRLIAETVAMVPLLVYDGDPLERERARDSWQWELLHDAPNEDQSSFDFFQDVATSIESRGNAFIWKLRVRSGRVEALYVLDPALVTVRRNEANRKVFRITQDGQTRDYTEDTILHIRGWTSRPGADEGVSPIALHRERLGGILAQDEFENRFYRNNAVPSVAISVPGALNEARADEMREWWEEQHSGLRNAHRPAILKNGATVEKLSITLEDAQFIEGKAFSIADVARIFRISPQILGAAVGTATSSPASVSEDFERFLKLDLAPRFRRIEMSLKRDRDLFGGGDLFPEFLADAVLRPDVKTRYEAYRLARQGGWLKPNEIREKENLPPADGGDEIQEVPVGGMANPGAPNEPGAQSDDAA
jgi:HK97 family phage portal protein